MTDPISIGQASLNTRPHALYRFYDASDVLLYVGITVDPGARFKKHRGDKPWWNDLDRIEIEKVGSRKEAEEAEKRAIKEEQPLYNVVHNEFVPGPRDGHMNKTVAWDIVYGYIGIDHDGDEHARLVAQARANAVEDEREFGDVEAEVACLLVGNLLHEAWTRRDEEMELQRCAELMVSALPDEVKELLVQRVQHDFYCAGEPEPTDETALPHLVRHAGRFIAELMEGETEGRSCDTVERAGLE